jgi:hypothetical protein
VGIAAATLLFDVIALFAWTSSHGHAYGAGITKAALAVRIVASVRLHNTTQ